MRAWAHAGRGIAAAVAIALSFITIPDKARADQGGISFWLPGSFGSLAATPVTPGWALGLGWTLLTAVAFGVLPAFRREEP